MTDKHHDRPELPEQGVEENRHTSLDVSLLLVATFIMLPDVPNDHVTLWMPPLMPRITHDTTLYCTCLIVNYFWERSPEGGGERP